MIALFVKSACTSSIPVMSGFEDQIEQHSSDQQQNCTDREELKNNGTIYAEIKNKEEVQERLVQLSGHYHKL